MQTDQFRAAMRAAGLDYVGPILADGQLHRFKTEGDHDRNSWFVLHAGPPAAGAFGCWKRGLSETWCECNGHLSQAEWNAVRQRWQEADRERKKTEAGRREQAKQTAAWILNRAKTVMDHTYLTTKGVTLFGDVREYRGALVLPLRDAKRELHSLQFVAADGSKRFLRGGRITGCFFTVADKADGALVIVEGFATGASVHKATGMATVAAMNAGNLLPVATSLREKFPSREMIIAGDNDQWTDGNPGVTKATEAAKAIGARLAMPQFKDPTTTPTDFNDLHQLQGLDAVKTQIEAATLPTEKDDDVIARLAALPPLEYERQRDAAADKLGCRTSILDKLVDGKRPRTEPADAELQGRTLNLPDVEPWPDAVNGADVLDAITEAFGRYVVLPAGAADAIALWVAHTHCFDAFTCSPRLNVSSPEKGCGKTTLRDVLAVFVPRPMPAENLSAAVLFRVTQSHRPTLLADECDRYLSSNDELLSMLNAGHRRGGQALRCEGDRHEVRAFSVFTPSVLCGIGSLPGTLHDRSIVIRLERAKPGELRERFDSRRIEHEQELCRRLARWCSDHAARLADCDPALPDGAFNRVADNWRPLFAIAEIAGGDWPRRAAEAFARATNRDDDDAQGIGAMLLADIAAMFGGADVDKLPSIEMVKRLAELEGREWAEWGRARKPISVNQLAKQLRRFNVAPRNIKTSDGKVLKGYHAEDFKEAFDRYLPVLGDSNRYPATKPVNIDDSPLSQPLPAKTGSGLETAPNTNVYAGGSGVAVREPPEEASQEDFRL